MAAINPRFIYQVPFRDRKTMKIRHIPILNADGHVDYAHQIGLESITTEIVERWTEGNDDAEKTRWCIVKATVKMKSGVVAVAHSCVSDRDKFVNQPGREVEVAETRAKKRALADAANITEIVISPGETRPYRETVDMPLEKGDEEPEIPEKLKKTPGPVQDAEAEQRAKAEDQWVL